MVRLSVNVNKVATLRNARGKNQPNLIEVVQDLISFGVQGITLHPRPDGRHILYEDVRQIAKLLQAHPTVELNVEGYPSPQFLKLIEDVTPHQCTLVPDPPSVLTSNAGWAIQKNFDLLKNTLASLKKNKVRTSLFLDPQNVNTKELTALTQLKPERAELYTEAYAQAYNTDQREQVTHTYTRLALSLVKQGTQVNAGHDLNLNNLSYLLYRVPQIKEVSIGHALICEALYQGLEVVTKKYLKVCAKKKDSLMRGALCEDTALRFFKEQGWQLHKRNQKIRGVEMDLIMEKPESWLLVEVKSDNAWRREKPMGQRQKERLSKAMSAFCENSSKPVRILLAIVNKQKKVQTFDMEF